MARLLGVDIPKKKRIVISLTYLHGVGNSLAKQICKKLSLSEDTKTETLTDSQVVDIRKVLDDYTLEGDLRREKSLNIKRLMDLGCYRGIRHRLGLPVRGQVTQKNARTRKGPKKTMANKKK